jgi:hypothetical protein
LQFEHFLGIRDGGTFGIIMLRYRNENFLILLGDQLFDQETAYDNKENQGQIDKNVIGGVAIHWLISQNETEVNEVKPNSLIVSYLTITPTFP